MRLAQHILLISALADGTLNVHFIVAVIGTNILSIHVTTVLAHFSARSSIA
jgi:hypothetical protein